MPRLTGAGADADIGFHEIRVLIAVDEGAAPFLGTWIQHVLQPYTGNVRP